MQRPAGRTNIQMHVVHLVHSPERVADIEACTAPYTHAYQFSRFIVHRNEAWVVKHLPILVATDVHVNVRDGADAKAFVKRVETPVRIWSSYLLRMYDAHGLTVTTKHVKTAVKMMATIVRVEAPTHLTNS